MEKLIQSALKKGALAAKVCGAGGGGCVAFVVPARKKQTIIEELNIRGGNVLPFQFVLRGLQNQQIVQLNCSTWRGRKTMMSKGSRARAPNNAITIAAPVNKPK